ncbi:MAG TPA: SAM-dependent methyltransferase [Saprospiraceae bacterium]|nr:SAM-dependent methyltransferase [Saprospiraceae bacterium]HMQ83306.1 SAM-dependent methyltransferase [Saprospiraceae bacterium]
MADKGTLYLIPSPLGEGQIHTIPDYVLEVLHRLDYFIAERAKTARHFIKATQPTRPLDVLHFYELNQHTEPEEWIHFLQEAEAGHDMGLLSEAGCPGIADPGAVIVALAHRKGIQVVPFVGPSSIFLALMASGLNGQDFAFRAYLPQKKPELIRELKWLEQRCLKNRQTQIFIETPYRNQSMLETALETLSHDIQFCIAADLTLPSEFIRTQSIAEWRRSELPNLHKRPAVFLMGK